jgi:hypothetical protein
MGIVTTGTIIYSSMGIVVAEHKNDGCYIITDGKNIALTQTMPPLQVTALRLLLNEGRETTSYEYWQYKKKGKIIPDDPLHSFEDSLIRQESEFDKWQLHEELQLLDGMIGY